MKRVNKSKYENCQPIWFDADVEYIQSLYPKLKWQKYTHKNGKVIPNYEYAKYHDDQLQGFYDCMPFLKYCKYRASIVRITGSELEWHTDKNSQCAIIWGLDNWGTSCTYFLPEGHEGGNRGDHVRKWVYKNAIVDTSIEHKVILKESPKIIFKISIDNRSFAWLCKQWAKCYGGFKYRD